MTDDTKAGHPNLDPITKTPGAHPLGVGVGAVVGGVAGIAAGVAGTIAAGAAAGTLAGGPVGTVVGAAIGAVAGGLGGKAVAEHYDPTVEKEFWRENHANQPYARDGDFERYEPAYRAGWEGRNQSPDGRFEDHEAQVAEAYGSLGDGAGLGWTDARVASHAAWERRN